MKIMYVPIFFISMWYFPIAHQTLSWQWIWKNILLNKGCFQGSSYLTWFKCVRALHGQILDYLNAGLISSGIVSYLQNASLASMHVKLHTIKKGRGRSHLICFDLMLEQSINRRKVQHDFGLHWYSLTITVSGGGISCRCEDWVS